MSDSAEYSGITQATNSILEDTQYPGTEEILPPQDWESKISDWTEALTGFEAGSSVSHETHTRLQEINQLYQRCNVELAQYAADLGVKGLSDCSPKAVLFMICIRDLQQQYAGKSNMNPHKFSVLRGRRYSVT